MLRAIILAGFAIILGGMFYAFVEVASVLAMNKNLAKMTDDANRLNSLSKDLLIAENLYLTFEEWRSCRNDLEGEVYAFLDSPFAKRYLGDELGQKQDRNTKKLLGLISPKMDAIQNIAQRAMSTKSAYVSGLLSANVTPEEIREVRNFSLYIGDLLSVRVNNLNAYITDKSRSTLFFTFLSLNGLALLIMGIILVVLIALRKAQILNQENTEYLESILTAIYDISGQGFLTYDPNLRVDTSISRQSSRLLGQDPGNSDVAELLLQGENEREDFRQGMSLIFSGKAKPEVVFDLFEKEVSVNEHYLRINFRFLSAKRIMLALTDVSREHTLRAMVAEEEHRKTLILKAVANRFDFAAFVRDSRDLFSRIDRFADGDAEASPVSGGLDAILRRVHSLKGNAGFFGFTETAKAAHDLEFQIGDAKILGMDIDVPSASEALRSAFETEMGHIVGVLGESWLDDLDTIHVPKPAFLDLERKIAARLGDDPALVQRLKSFRSVPMRNLFARFPSMFEDLAERNGKLISQVTVSGGEFGVLPENFERLITSFVHLIRNIVDHGIETPSERELSGKDRSGSVSIAIRRADTGISIHFQDDGRGIRPEDLEAKARALGLVAEGDRPDRDTLYGLLLNPGLSTAKEVTMLSGRGAGLPAVNDAVVSYGGTITIVSTPGKGTGFEIFIPTKKDRK